MFSQKAVPIWLPAGEGVSILSSQYRASRTRAHPVRLAVSRSKHKGVPVVDPTRCLPETLMISRPMVLRCMGGGGRE